MTQQTRVPPEGSRESKIALIGEAPGAREIREGRPFVGPAGRLLNRLLNNAGILRHDCYITNVVKVKPPNTSQKSNDISHYINLSKKVPTVTDEYEAFEAELRDELASTSANVFVAFGNVPLYALTKIHPPKITKRRGSVYECSLVPNRKVVACIHPAACIHMGRQGGMYIWQYFILHDLKRALEESKDSAITKSDFGCFIEPTFEECTSFLERVLVEAEEVAYDIEVINLEVSCISFAYLKEAISIPFTQQGQPYFTPDQEAEVWTMIARILEAPSIIKVGQNLTFDMQFLFRKYGIRTTNIDDTMIAQGILVPDFPKGLDFITSIYTNEPYYKDDGKMYLKYGGREDDFWLYNAKDSAVCLEAFPKQMSEIASLGNEETYEAQKKLVPILVYMSERGFRMDIEGLRAESARTGDRISELSERLNKMCGYDINPNSPKQLAEYFYEHRGYKPYIKRGTGSVTTDEDALKRLARKGAPEASILLEIRRLTKLKGTYLDVALDEDGRLRCSFNPVGAADSGRLSSSKTIWGTGMNMQNDPPAFRKFMLADEGYVLYSMDLGQAENRVVAFVAPEYKMIEAFGSNQDVHSLTASLISGLSPEEVRRQYEEGDTCPIGQGVYTWRFWGKKANHGLNYGLGYKTFAFYYEIPERDAKFIVTRYHQAYPGVRDYHRWVEDELRKDRTVTNIFGRRRKFMDRWGDALFKEAYSFIPQSTVADKINRQGLIEVYYDQGKYQHVEILNQVHDSIVFQIPLSAGWDYHAKVLLSIKESLEAPLSWRGREFIIPTNLFIGKNFLDVKEKEPGGKMMEVKWTSNLSQALQEMWRKISSIK